VIERNLSCVERCGALPRPNSCSSASTSSAQLLVEAKLGLLPSSAIDTTLKPSDVSVMK
jgi:hypothetical protein